MHSYCVRELKFSEDATLKRIQVARKARQFRRSSKRWRMGGCT
jgi:hypothetical protein